MGGVIVLQLSQDWLGPHSASTFVKIFVGYPAIQVMLAHVPTRETNVCAVHSKHAWLPFIANARDVGRLGG